MIDPRMVQEFLAQPRLVVVGASDATGNFGRTVVAALRSHGTEVAAVHPTATEVAGVPCYADLASVPGDIDGAVVMVGSAAAVDVVRAAIDRGVPRVWLFRGLGGPGAVSEEAVSLCREHGVRVIEGACPIMFLEPVGWFHRLHRFARRRSGAILAA